MPKILEPSKRTLADVEVISREVVFQEWSTVEKATFRHRRFDGTWSDPVTRELHYVGEVVNVLAWDPSTDYVVLVEQYRPPGIIHNEASWLFECIAGLIDTDNESPEDVARREAEEEAGCALTDLKLISHIYSSPGAWTEKSYLFLAQTDLSDVGGLHGLEHEQEDIRAVTVPHEEAMKATNDGRIRDAKTILLLQWLALNKKNLLKTP
ncbi:MAG: NUDIX domain-containing protein [Parvibaculaceae bacterium]|nr:NUDIX domain-containing protein [Parvibaculaceae bacterium]